MGFGLFTLFRSLNIRHENYKTVSIAIISKTLGNSGTKIILGFMGMGFLGLIAGELVGIWIGASEVVLFVWTVWQRS